MLLKSIFRIVVVLILAVIVMVSVVLITIKRVQEENKPIQIPDLVGKDIIDATKEIESEKKYNAKDDSKKIKINITSVGGNQQPRYTVVKQMPEPGLQIKEGREITLQISSGEQSAKVQNYAGKEFKKVRQELYPTEFKQRYFLQEKMKSIEKVLSQKSKPKQKLKEINQILDKKPADKKSPLCVLGKVSFKHDPVVEKGFIIEQQKPKPGKELDDYKQIDLVVSLGNSREYLKVQNYVGKHVEEVIKILEDRNIFIKDNKPKNVSGTAEDDGKIVFQGVKSGEKLYLGDEIELHVANYNPDNKFGKYKMIKYIIPNLYQKETVKKKPKGKKTDKEKKTVKIKTIKVKIIVRDKKGSAIIYEGQNKPGDKIVECAKIIGEGVAEVYLDGKKLQVINLK